MKENVKKVIGIALFGCLVALAIWTGTNMIEGTQALSPSDMTDALTVLP